MNFNKILLLIGCILIVSCGKKQRNLFVFETQEKISIDTLTLPVIKGINVTTEESLHHPTWFDIASDQPTTPSTAFQGYNVYQTTQAGFVQRTALNHHPLKEASFTTPWTKSTTGYTVRGVFSISEKLFLGPASRIVAVSTL